MLQITYKPVSKLGSCNYKFLFYTYSVVDDDYTFFILESLHTWFELKVDIKSFNPNQNIKVDSSKLVVIITTNLQVVLRIFEVKVFNCYILDCAYFMQYNFISDNEDYELKDNYYHVRC